MTDLVEEYVFMSPFKGQYCNVIYLFTQPQGTLDIPVEKTTLMSHVPEIQYKSVVLEIVYPKICDSIPQSLQTCRHGISMGSPSLISTLFPVD